ncbi:MAG TPA: hypothetical protein VGR08_07950 [Thermomicrobiales bacterium]|nr:hypothetical protein [Thermomicrobiales bacterium]
MIEIANRIEVALISPQAFGVTLMLFVALVARANRPFLRDVISDTDRSWRALARAAATCMGASLVWVGMMDNWFQLLLEPYRLSRRWESQRVVFDPVASEVRTVSLVVLALVLLTGAALFARHIGGYLLQGALLIVGIAMWGPLFILQQRADVMVIDGVSTSEHWGAYAGVAAFWLLRTVLCIAFVSWSVLIGLMLVAPMVTLLLDLMRWRYPRTTHEADPFFSRVQSHARDHEDVPLRDRWRPIRQPS